MSPLNKERWHRFKKNRRGYISLWLFLCLFLMTLPAEFLANDAPLMIRYDGDFYFPVVKEYSELEFGGDFDISAEYTDPYLAGLINEKGWMLWPPIPFDYSTRNSNLTQPAPSPPSDVNWLGTDDQGRDVLARLIYGFRVSVLFGLMLTIATSIIGVAAGAVQGFYGGKIDLIGQRLLEVWSSVPTLFVLIIIASMVTPSFWILLVILLLFGWMALVGVVRAEFLRARNLDYVMAARALGVADRTLIFRHLLPNAMVATITFVPFVMVSAITSLTALDFLGFGLPPGSASLGEMVSQGKNNLYAPWIGISVFVALALLLSLLVFIGEAVRDAVDPNRTR
ncbi:ABC transporter permease [Gilvimarinus sp. SDUM040013]|uniref:ABC transporter permease n=1 Tax=Gilvimarinus gilvus TaxID=3058038 RepID=A0ABU4RWS2_9GAMM|nr:ABC transporter permease [Gilvimarinus sp. SDUM040013]MDO3385693.1 ABC transporter permease [Gilvimarinus sp. SDUM040013]MDX6849331.1 ABC transporter permease [Gilvimarinus sp. SDUM040013]